MSAPGMLTDDGRADRPHREPRRRSSAAEIPRADVAGDRRRLPARARGTSGKEFTVVSGATPIADAIGALAP